MRKVMTRLPAEPLPGPKKNWFDEDVDCRKNGDDMFPTGALLLARLKILVALIQKLIA